MSNNDKNKQFKEKLPAKKDNNNKPGYKLNDDEIEGLIAKYDKELNYRRPEGIAGSIVFIFAVSWSIFQLYTGIFGAFPDTLQRAPHISAALVLVYLLYPAHGKPTKRIPFYDYLLAILSMSCAIYHIINYEELLLRAGMFNIFDIIISVLAIVLIIEAARRVAGIIISCLCTLFLFYALYGHYLPGFLHHSPLSFKRVVCFQYLSTEGILGSPAYVSSTFIFLFLVFAVFLKRSGVGDWMTNLSLAICGGSVGGPAKAAVVASALQGTISGSSVANVVSTGSITIPLMKKTGYRAEFAGAVEAAASTGGQIMPPIMGAAAFIMAEYIGCSYGKVALAAVIPACLYFAGIFSNVHFEAVKQGLRGIPKEQRPIAKELWKRGWYMLLPVVVIVWLLISGRSAMRAGLFGIFACIIIWIIEIIRNEKKFDSAKFFKEFFIGLYDSALSAIAVATTCGCVGIIVGSVTLTGLGLKMAGGIVGLAGGSLLLTMIFTMVCSLVLGMGVPTTANYIIQATISAPAMVALGVPPIAAHLFVFYFGIVSDITPPVCLAAFAGAGIAGANTMSTGLTATRLGVAAYIVPYMFVYNPVLVLVNVGNWSLPIFTLQILQALVSAMIGMIAVASGFTAYFRIGLKIWERVALLIAGLLMIIPESISDIVGVFIFATIWIIQTAREKKVINSLE